MRNIEQEYATQAPDLMDFYARTPKELADGRAALVRWEAALVEELRRNNRDLGVAAEVPAEAVPIVTGQQPGLFTGPLYTVYKAITAIKLARQLEERSGIRHVPVFWVGSDDHDFEEARSAHFLGKNHEPFTLRYDPQIAPDGRPMFNVPLEDTLHGFVDIAASQTAGSELRSHIAELLHDSLRASSSLAEWSARLLADLFRGTSLILFSPHWTVARNLAAPVIERELEQPLRSTNLLNVSGARLQAMGFPQQVNKASQECNFFLLANGRRRKVIFRDGRFVVPEERRDYAPEDLRAMLADDPTQFSPNVALRCLVQQQVLGSAAYVAGPGELAYWAQLKPLFEQFELPMPVVYPRAHAVLTDIKLNKLRDKLGVSMEDLDRPTELLVEQVLERTADGPALALVRERRPGAIAPMRELAERLSGEDAAAGEMADALVARFENELARLERSILLKDRAQREAVEKRIARVCNTLAPWRKPQERTFTVFSFLFQQGPELITRLIDELDPESHALQEVEL